MAPQTLYAETLQMADYDEAVSQSGLASRLAELARRALPVSLLLIALGGGKASLDRLLFR